MGCFQEDGLRESTERGFTTSKKMRQLLPQMSRLLRCGWRKGREGADLARMIFCVVVRVRTTSKVSLPMKSMWNGKGDNTPDV